jgi:predicted thioesterase
MFGYRSMSCPDANSHGVNVVATPLFAGHVESTCGATFPVVVNDR